MTVTALNHSFVPWRCSARGPFCPLPISRLILYVHNATSSRRRRQPAKGRGTISSEEIFFSFLLLFLSTSLSFTFYSRRFLSLARTVTNFVVPTICTLRNFYSMQNYVEEVSAFRTEIVEEGIGRWKRVARISSKMKITIRALTFIRLREILKCRNSHFFKRFLDFSLRKNFNNISLRKREIFGLNVFRSMSSSKMKIMIRVSTFTYFYAKF